MKILREGKNPEDFYRHVAQARRRVLLLDYDGTLAPFRAERDRALPYPGVREALQKIGHDRRTRLVIVSGRAVDDLLPLLGLENPPEVWGSHGLEHRKPDGTATIAPMDPKALRALADADAWVQAEGLQAQAEEKPGCLALHWRGLPAAKAQELHRHALHALEPLALGTGLDLKAFDGGLELRVNARSKADAVHAILAQEPAGVPVAYLGDDRTDEDAFLELGSRGLRVLVRPQLRSTEADVWLTPPGELLEFLAQWLPTEKVATP